VLLCLTHTLAQGDTPIIAAQHAGESFVVKRALIRHADLAGDGIGGSIGDSGIGMDIADLGIGARLCNDEPCGGGGNALALVLW